MPPRRILNEDSLVHFTCPSCSHKISKTVRELNSDEVSACPACRRNLKPEGGTKAVTRIEDMIGDVGRQLREIFKKP